MSETRHLTARAEPFLWRVAMPAFAIVSAVSAMAVIVYLVVAIRATGAHCASVC